MNEALGFLLRHGYAVLFAWVFVEQIGLPLPSVPLLLAAGALAGTGRLSPGLAISLPIVAALLSDVIWYELGRRRGVKVLQLLCRISLEPDSCVRRTENVFARHGARSLLVAKFIPGLNTAAPPLSGIFRMRFGRFLLFDTLGTILWAGVFTGLGYAFSDQLERIADRALTLGTWLVVLLLAGLFAYIGWKFVMRQRFLRQLRIARITPEELKQKLDAGEDIIIVDRATRSTSKPSPRPSPARFAWTPPNSKRRTRKFRATAMWSSTALDPTRQAAPVWRSCSGDGGSPASGHSPEV